MERDEVFGYLDELAKINHNEPASWLIWTHFGHTIPKEMCSTYVEMWKLDKGIDRLLDEVFGK